MSCTKARSNCKLLLFWMNSSRCDACWLKLLKIFFLTLFGIEALAKKFADLKGIEAIVIVCPAWSDIDIWATKINETLQTFFCAASHKITLSIFDKTDDCAVEKFLQVSGYVYLYVIILFLKADWRTSNFWLVNGLFHNDFWVQYNFEKLLCKWNTFQQLDRENESFFRVFWDWIIS